MKMRVLGLILCSGILLFSESTFSQTQGFHSPQEAFECVKNTVNADDLKGSYFCMTIDSRDVLLRKSIRTARSTLKEYGIFKSEYDALISQNKEQRTDKSEKIYSSLNQLENILSDHLTIPIDQAITKDQDIQTIVKDPNEFLFKLRQTELDAKSHPRPMIKYIGIRDIQIDGDKAVGIVATEVVRGGESRMSDVYFHFKSVDGKWFYDFNRGSPEVIKDEDSNDQ